VPSKRLCLSLQQLKVMSAIDRRPKLRQAIDQARKKKASVVVAKLDRLSRDVAFILGLMAKHAIPV
jgi:DNA invertase Pin-like site-specific DNA recombinase